MKHEFRELYVDLYEDHGLNYTFIDFDGRSDYDGFIRGGILGGGIATGAEGIKIKEEAKLFGGVAETGMIRAITSFRC
jgi:aminopeptidase Y